MLSTVTMANRRLTSADHPRDLCAQMYKLQTEGTYCDIIIEVGINRVCLHSVVLAGCSDILATELTQGRSDDTSCLSLLGSLDVIALQRLVRFFYMGELLLGEGMDVAAICVCCQRMGLLAGVQMCEAYVKERDLAAKSATAVDSIDSLNDAQIRGQVTDGQNQTVMTDGQNQTVMTDGQNQTVLTDGQNQTVMTDGQNQTVMMARSSVEVHHCRAMTKFVYVTDCYKVKVHQNLEPELVTGRKISEKSNVSGVALVGHSKAPEFKFNSANNRNMRDDGKDNVLTQSMDEEISLETSNESCSVARKGIVLVAAGGNFLYPHTTEICTTQQTDTLRDMEKGRNVNCIIRCLSKKLMSTCDDSGGEVVCRRSGRVKQVPKRYIEDIAWGITPGHIGTFGTQCGADPTQTAYKTMKGEEHSDHGCDPVVGGEMAGSNCEHNSQCKSDEDVKPSSSVQYRSVVSLRKSSATQELDKQNLLDDSKLSPKEANKVAYKCFEEITTAAVEDIPSSCDVPAKTRTCKMSTEREPPGPRGKYKRRKCSVCKETFVTPNILIEHRKSCHPCARGPNPRKYSCEQCPYVARTEKLLLIHMNNKHDVPLTAQDKYPVHTCQVNGCDYKSLYKQYIWRHHEAQHTGRMFVCEYCGKALRSKVALTLHVRIHLGVKPYVCQICGHTFRQSSILKCHQRSVHETHPHHLFCHECPYTTSKKTSLDLHCYRRHAVALPSNISIYHCDICQFETVSKNTLQCHVRRHLGQRPFECKVCHKTFVSSGDLRGHAVWHLPVSERKYKCPYEKSEGCQYVAATNSKLTSHVRLQHTHKDDRPFTCHMCPYKTGVKGNLTKHLRSMHHIEVTTHQVRVTPCCRGCQTTPVTATDSTSTTSVEEVSSDITGISMTSDILTPVMISSSAELMRLDSTVLGSDDLLRQSNDI